MDKNFEGHYLSNGEELDIFDKVGLLPLVTIFRKKKLKIIILGPIPL